MTECPRPPDARHRSRLVEWYDVLSWWSFELGLETRFVELTHQTWSSIVLGQQGQDDIEETVTFHSRVFNTPDTPLITTNRVCVVVSSYKMSPLLFHSMSTQSPHERVS